MTLDLEQYLPDPECAECALMSDGSQELAQPTHELRSVRSIGIIVIPNHSFAVANCCPPRLIEVMCAYRLVACRRLTQPRLKRFTMESPQTRRGQSTTSDETVTPCSMSDNMQLSPTQPPPTRWPPKKATESCSDRTWTCVCRVHSRA